VLVFYDSSPDPSRLLVCSVQPDRCQWVCRARSLLKGLRCGAPTRRRRALDVKDFTYARTGYTPRTPGAELALASADLALGGLQARRFTVNPDLTPNDERRNAMTATSSLPVGEGPRLLLTVPDAVAALSISRSKLYELLTVADYLAQWLEAHATTVKPKTLGG
jgi:hypothetical protein